MPSLICLNAVSHVSPDEYRAGKLLLTRSGALLSKLCLQGVSPHFFGYVHV